MNQPDWYSRISVVDTETTGIDTKTCKIVEVAAVGFHNSWDALVNPDCPIPPEASAIHHISDEDVANELLWEQVKPNFLNFIACEDGLPILVAHNADYDRAVLGDIGDVIWICTYKCALRVWPDAPSHKNEALRYHLKLGNNRGRSSSHASHSALHDASVTFLILQELLQHATLEQLVEWTELPAKLPRMPMGKHYGQTWDTVPGPYLQWCINQADMREDVKYCAKQELERRRTNRG